jgi:histidinol-phosphatase (PHP family)
MTEPYVSASILGEAQRMGIPVVPGDDAHGVDDVGLNIDEGMAALRAAGFDTAWRVPSPKAP